MQNGGDREGWRSYETPRDQSTATAHKLHGTVRPTSPKQQTKENEKRKDCRDERPHIGEDKPNYENGGQGASETQVTGPHNVKVVTVG